MVDEVGGQSSARWTGICIAGSSSPLLQAARCGKIDNGLNCDFLTSEHQLTAHILVRTVHSLSCVVHLRYFPSHGTRPKTKEGDEGVR